MIKNTILKILFLIISISVFSQVGINTMQPNENSFLHVSEQNLNDQKIFKGILLAKYTQLERDTQFINFTENEEGLIIYNLTQGCFNYWKHNRTTSTGVWTIYGECEDEGTIDNLNCSSLAINPITVNDNYNSSLIIPYTNGNGGTYSSISIPSRGVIGLTITLSTGNFELGNGELVFSISGIPTSIGNALFDIEIGGVSCSISIPVESPNDIQSLDCIGTNARLPSLSDEYNFTTTNYIKYTGGNGNAYNAYSIPSTGGVTGLTLIIEAGNLEIGDGLIYFKITGRASTTGIARFNVDLGGLQCEIVLTIYRPPSVGSLDCSNPLFSSTPVVNNAYVGTMIMGYTNGNGGAYTPLSITSTGVEGLRMVIGNNLLANGNGELTFNITGTPDSSGIATFQFTIAGETCSVNLPVSAEM